MDKRRRHMMSGAFAVMTTTTLLQPCDVVKTLYLTGDHSLTIKKSIQYVYRRYGLIGFWKGFQPTLLRAVIGGSIFFPTIELVRERLKRYQGFSTNVLASALTRTTTIVLLCPLTVLKVRMEAPQSQIYSNLSEGLRLIYKEEGIKGYYRGLGPYLMRDIPYSGLAFGLYQYYYSLAVLMGFSPEKSTTNMGAAAIGSISATFLTQPFDVLKTRLQYAYKDASHLHNYRGVFDGISKVWKAEGVKGFTRGLAIRLAERCVSYILVWGLYEKVKTHFLAE